MGQNGRPYMTRDELEFSISQYLDGTLPSGERLALEARIAEDAEARQLLAEYQQLDVVLKGVGSPEVRWETFASHLSGVVAQATVDAVAAPADDIDVEFLVSQYLDGTLSVEERAAFEVRLLADAGAAALLSEHRRVERVVKTSLPLPPVRWDALAEHLGAVVFDAGAKPIFSFKWARTAGRIAVAACVLVATMVSVHVIRTNRPVTGPVVQGPPSVPPAAVAIISGPQLEQAPGTPVVEIEIGGPAVAVSTPDNGGTPVEIGAGGSVQFADVVVARPSRVVIAAGNESAQDGGQMPY